MAPASSICASCLRVARSAASRAATKPANTSVRSYSRTAATCTSTTRNAYAAKHTSESSWLSRSFTKPSSTPAAHRIPRRSFATTSDPSAARQAQAILNPRNDESGNPMLISMSPRASNRLHAISAGDKNPDLALRVSIESGGCHGFQYLMDLTDLNKSPATDEDTVFQGEKGEKVIIDEPSLELLNGSTVDYAMELIGSQFKITGIPGATSSCGCGTSFDIKL